MPECTGMWWRQKRCEGPAARAETAVGHNGPAGSDTCARAEQERAELGGVGRPDGISSGAMVGRLALGLWSRLVGLVCDGAWASGRWRAAMLVTAGVVLASASARWPGRSLTASRSVSRS